MPRPRFLSQILTMSLFSVKNLWRSRVRGSIPGFRFRFRLFISKNNLTFPCSKPLSMIGSHTGVSYPLGMWNLRRSGLITGGLFLWYHLLRTARSSVVQASVIWSEESLGWVCMIYLPLNAKAYSISCRTKTSRPLNKERDWWRWSSMAGFIFRTQE